LLNSGKKRFSTEQLTCTGGRIPVADYKPFNTRAKWKFVRLIGSECLTEDRGLCKIESTDCTPQDLRCKRKFSVQVPDTQEPNGA
jgi:hypothetical protein